MLNNILYSIVFYDVGWGDNSQNVATDPLRIHTLSRLPTCMSHNAPLVLFAIAVINKC